MQQHSEENSFHPSKKELADFLENRLDEARRREIVRHLIECDTCSDMVALVKKYGKVNAQKEEDTGKHDNSKPLKPQAVNDVNYSGGLIAVDWFYSKQFRAIVGGMAALFCIYIILPNNEDITSVGKNYKSISNEEINDISIEKSIKELKATVNLQYLEELDNFQQAQKYILVKNYYEARNSYTKVMREIEESSFTDNDKEKYLIIVNYHIWRLSIKESNQESANEYLKKIKDDIRRLGM